MAALSGPERPHRDYVCDRVYTLGTTREETATHRNGEWRRERRVAGTEERRGRGR